MIRHYKQNITQKILQTQTDSRCSLCQQYGTTTDHIISVYTILAKEQYIKSHDTVCAELHLNIRKKIGVIRQCTLVWACTEISRNKS